jgi:3-dehydroquinate dehydratase I
VLDVARAIRQAGGSIPIIFTRRASHEGGEAIGVAEEAVVALYETVAASGLVDIIDYELSQSSQNKVRLRAASRSHGVSMILSYHNFKNTPAVAELVGKIAAAEQQGADIAKVAVMPAAPGDVLVLLEATLAASAQVQIPIVTMSMGAVGAMSRLCGWMYGSVITYAVGQGSSAPGQMPIDDLRAALTALQHGGAGDGV